MLRFERDVLLADLNERTIEGVVVPYGEVGVIAGREYRFKPGSIRLGKRTPLLVDHDRSRPIGVLAELVDQPSGALGRFRVDATADGDEALTQAASGSRGSLSIGAEVVRSSIARDGVVDVEAALVLETSLLALGAFESAAVTRVAAEQDGEEEAEEAGAGDGQEADLDSETEEEDEAEDGEGPAPGQEELELEPEDDAGAAGDDPEGGTPMNAAFAAPVIRAERSRPASELRAGELVHYLIRAQHGEVEAVRFLEAQLDETPGADILGLLPPIYERAVIGGKEIDRPLYTVFRGRPLPAAGINVNKPVWKTYPDGAWAADLAADATTGAVKIETQIATVQRWDWAGAFPWVLVQRSDPDLIDTTYAQAVQDFYLDVEAKIGGELAAATVGVAVSLGAAIAEFYRATGNQRAPEVIIMAPDVWGAFADATALSVAVAAGAVSGESLTTSFAGIPVVSSGTLNAGQTFLATRRAIDARITEPVRLTANAIGALNVELAVVGEGLFDTDYRTELLGFPAIVPAAASGPAASRSSK